jgi:hypothetical protein
MESLLLLVRPSEVDLQRRADLVQDRLGPFRGAAPREGSPWRSRNRPRREKPMCANCGCGVPEDKHGDDRNISWSEVVASAEANSISPAEAVQNMQAMAQQQA